MLIVGGLLLSFNGASTGSALLMPGPHGSGSSLPELNCIQIRLSSSASFSNRDNCKEEDQENTMIESSAPGFPVTALDQDNHGISAMKIVSTNRLSGHSLAARKPDQSTHRKLVSVMEHHSSMNFGESRNQVEYELQAYARKRCIFEMRQPQASETTGAKESCSPSLATCRRARIWVTNAHVP